MSRLSSRAPTKIRNNKKKFPALRLASWNVRTMMPGFTDDLQQIKDGRKTAVIDAELNRLNVDIAALQETRLAENGTITEKHYTFFWQGKANDDRREHGVGFAVKTTLLPMTEPPTAGTERLLSLRLNTSSGPINLFSVYAPTLNSSAEAKDQFYSDLDKLIEKVPPSENLYLLGDFNARVGSEHSNWPSCIGHYGIGRINENGQRLLELCCNRNLCVTNTFFQNKPVHQVSWRHPRSHQWHQLDLVVTRRNALPSTNNTRSYHSADCDTDHSLVISKVSTQAKRFHTAKPKGLPKINTAHSNDTVRTTELLNSVRRIPPAKPGESATARWTLLSSAIHESAIEAYGKQERRNVDWYDANLTVMEPQTIAKRQALLNYKNSPNQKTLEALRRARNKSQELARKCANDYWLQLCTSIEKASVNGNTREMYEGIRQATGPAVKKTAPLKSKTGEVITDSNMQMERWVEHYLDLYSTQNEVSDEAVSSIPSADPKGHLDNIPTIKELEKAIKSLKSGKAPGSDCIPPEVLKQGKEALLPHLHELLSMCWDEGEVPKDMRDSKIVTLYKNKGDRSDCNNYRGISLLSIVGKVFARVALGRLQQLAEEVYPESQCGFRAGRSTTDMIFSVRQLQEKCREQRQPLYIAFVDLTKAFDLVSRSGLFKLLERIGCPPKLLSIIRSYHTDMQGTVSFNGETSKPFNILSGVKQGCVLAPTLFGIFFSLLLSYAFRSSSDGVYIHTRHDGKLYNLARLKAKTKVTRVLIRELLFADDAALASHTHDGLQRLLDRFSKACKEFALTISVKKTEVLAQDVPIPPSISVNDTSLAVVENFRYLGSNISDKLSLDPEINARIGKAATVMSKLNKRVWENNNLTLTTRLKVYQACVISTLLYGSETWTTYTKQESKLNAFHLRCLRRILGVSWRDKVTTTEILRRANTCTVFAMLSERRLRWLGHVRRMGAHRIPKDLLYGQLENGTRALGRPCLRFKDACKRDLRSANIDVDTWETTAADRLKWRQSVKMGIKRLEESQAEKREDHRMRRKASKTSEDSVFVCVDCKRDCHSRIGLCSHRRRCSSSTTTRNPSSTETDGGR